MANLQELQAQLQAKEQEIKQAREAKIQAYIAAAEAEELARKAAEADKPDEEKVADLLAKLAKAEEELNKIK